MPQTHFLHGMFVNVNPATLVININPQVLQPLYNTQIYAEKERKVESIGTIK